MYCQASIFRCKIPFSMINDVWKSRQNAKGYMDTNQNYTVATENKRIIKKY